MTEPTATNVSVFDHTVDVTSPDFARRDGESDAEYMGRVAQESATFQLQMVAYNNINASSNRAIDTLDKVADRQAN